MSIFLSSDLHFGHDREFLWGPRGFKSIEEHDEAIIKNWNELVTPEDTVYILGDLMLGDNNHGIECLNRLNGSFIVIRGNHDTDTRIQLYQSIDKIKEIYDAHYLKYGKYHFYLSHYPTMTGNFNDSGLKHMTLNLSGHTHSKNKFYEDRPYMYNVALDANDNKPVLIDNIITSMKEKVDECINFL